MSSPDVISFVARFEAMWRDPQPESFADLFDAEGTLFHPTMDKPISRAEVPGYVRRLKALIPDIALAVESWAANENVVLIEWVLGGTFGGDYIKTSGADRFTLRGDRALEGVAYFDTAPLWAMIDPSMARGHLLDVVEEAALAR